MTPTGLLFVAILSCMHICSACSVCQQAAQPSLYLALLQGSLLHSGVVSGLHED